MITTPPIVPTAPIVPISARAARTPLNSHTFSAIFLPHYFCKKNVKKYLFVTKFMRTFAAFFRGTFTLSKTQKT